MATLSKQGNELYRFFSINKRGLISVRDNGTVLRRTPWSGGWKVLARKKPEISLEEWKGKKREQYENLAPWKREVRSLPSFETLQEWEHDGICETPTGHKVEPDGVGPDGVPSWLRCLSII
jgi:hypothetical protein